MYPEPYSSIDFRLTNRKYISHVLYEQIEAENYITFITVHPGHWAFRAQSHSLHHPCGTTSLCILLGKKIHAFLQSGKNLGLHLNGSIIQKIDFYEDN